MPDMAKLQIAVKRCRLILQWRRSLDRLRAQDLRLLSLHVTEVIHEVKACLIFDHDVVARPGSCNYCIHPSYSEMVNQCSETHGFPRTPANWAAPLAVQRRPRSGFDLRPHRLLRTLWRRVTPAEQPEKAVVFWVAWCSRGRHQDLASTEVRFNGKTFMWGDVHACLDKFSCK